MLSRFALSLLALTTVAAFPASTDIDCPEDAITRHSEESKTIFNHINRNGDCWRSIEVDAGWGVNLKFHGLSRYCHTLNRQEIRSAKIINQATSVEIQICDSETGNMIALRGPASYRIHLPKGQRSVSLITYFVPTILDCDDKVTEMSMDLELELVPKNYEGRCEISLPSTAVMTLIGIQRKEGATEMGSAVEVHMGDTFSDLFYTVPAVHSVPAPDTMDYSLPCRANLLNVTGRIGDVEKIVFAVHKHKTMDAHTDASVDCVRPDEY